MLLQQQHRASNILLRHYPKLLRTSFLTTNTTTTTTTTTSTTTTPILTSTFTTLSRQLHHRSSSPPCSRIELSPYNTPARYQQQQLRTMSDDAYAAFLAKANKDYSAGAETSITTAADVGEKHEPHPAIKALGERFYVSDADEPFVSVEFAVEGDVDVASFSKLIDADSDDVEVLTVNDWDPQNQYGDVVDAVKKAAGSTEVKIYRVSQGGVKAYYFIVGLDKSGKNIKGVKVKAVES